MNTLKTLLQNADPLRHEDPPLEADRERIRQTLVRTAPATRSRRPVPAALVITAMLAISAIGVAALGYQLWLLGSTPVLAAVRLEMRLAEDRPIPGLIVAQASNPTRMIYLHPEIVVSNDDIAQSWVVQDGPERFGVAVQLLPSGALRMREATRNHVGRPLAILIDGDIVAIPVLRSPISDSALINGMFTQKEAERIANGIGNR